MRFVPVIASVGAAALLAGVSVVAADSHIAHGKAVSAVATSKATEGEGHGDAVSAAAKVRETVRTTAVKPVVRTSAMRAASVACSTAMAGLKAAVAADRIEDQTERKARVVTGTTEANEASPIKSNGLAGEDATELTALRNAFTSVRAACLRPEVLETETAACTAAENAVLLTSLGQAEGCPD